MACISQAKFFKHISYLLSSQGIRIFESRHSQYSGITSAQAPARSRSWDVPTAIGRLTSRHFPNPEEEPESVTGRWAPPSPSCMEFWSLYKWPKAGGFFAWGYVAPPFFSGVEWGKNLQLLNWQLGPSCKWGVDLLVHCQLSQPTRNWAGSQPKTNRGSLKMPFSVQHTGDRYNMIQHASFSCMNMLQYVTVFHFNLNNNLLNINNYNYNRWFLMFVERWLKRKKFEFGSCQWQKY